MENLIKRIARLEVKKFNGTITTEQEVLYVKLLQFAAIHIH